MRGVFKAVAAVALIALVVAPVTYADDPLPGTEPPQIRIAPPTGIAAQPESSARIGPPIGVAAQARIGPPTGIAATTQRSGVRILPPIGVSAPAPPSGVRIGPPTGVTAQDASPSVFELFWDWLMIRIGPPIG